MLAWLVVGFFESGCPPTRPPAASPEGAARPHRPMTDRLPPEIFAWREAYADRCASEPSWPRLPERLVGDARRQAAAYGAATLAAP